MLLNLLSLGALVFLAFIFFTLFLRSVHSHHIAARIVGGLLGALLTLVFVAALGAALFGLWRTSVPRVRPLPAIKVTSTPELITRGRALAQSCVPCHSFDGSPDLNGGTRNMAVGYVVYGDVYPRNLTPAAS